MVLVIDTAAENVLIGLWDQDWTKKTEFVGGRELNALIIAKLQETVSDYSKITGIIVNAGPGSFTGLRIGLSVANTIAYTQDIPIVGITDPKDTENLIQKGKIMLESASSGFTEGIVPHYGAEPHITKPNTH